MRRIHSKIFQEVGNKRCNRSCKHPRTAHSNKFQKRAHNPYCSRLRRNRSRGTPGWIGNGSGSSLDSAVRPSPTPASAADFVRSTPSVEIQAGGLRGVVGHRSLFLHPFDWSWPRPQKSYCDKSANQEKRHILLGHCECHEHCGQRKPPEQSRAQKLDHTQDNERGIGKE